MHKFSDIIKGVTPKVDVLPLFHSCDLYSLRSILFGRLLTPQLCDVFEGERILYCFYGRPSYRIRLDGATKNISYFPACLILNTYQLPKPYKLYPFDTGAFVKLTEIKKQYFHKSMDVSSFVLGSGIDDARAMVEKVYSSNINYYDATPTISKSEIPVLNFEAACYLNFVASEVNTSFDDRVSSIEVMYDQDLTLNVSTIDNIVIPKILLDDADVSDILTKEFGIADPITYSTHKGNPIEYHGLFVEKVREYLTSKSTL